jgi:hypothetical protein
MPRYRKWPKCFSFDETQRRTMTFAGVRLDPTRHRLELVPEASGVFPTGPDLYAKTRVTTPGGCRKWAGFFALSRTHSNYRGESLTDVRFRLNDGTIERYWNAGAAAWVPASPNNWNTEQEVADNIAHWPVQSLGVVINLSTTNPRLTPYVTEIRLLFETDLVALEDYVIRSFVADLREQLRPISILAVDSTGQTTIDLNKLQVPYDIVEIDALYNNALDPAHMAPVTGWAYNATTKLLSIPVQPVGHRLEVRFVWRPDVVRMKSQDYTEIAKIPVLIVDDVEVVNTRQIRERPYVLNKATGDGFVFEDGIQGDIRVPLLLIAPSSRDLHVFGEEMSRYFANLDLLRVRGQDEFYPVWPDSTFDDRSTASQKETFSATVQARICNAVFYPEDARPITGVKRFKVTGGLTIEVP